MSEFFSDWIDFEKEIIYKNRYFCRHTMLQHIQKLSEKLREELPTSINLFRARIITKDEIKKDAKIILGDKLNTDNVVERCNLYQALGIYGFGEKQSGPPPAEKTQNGRTNPQFIPYFYLAKNPYTALAECKPYQFDNISIATYKTTKILKLACLNRFSDELFDEHTYYGELINHLNYIFSRPVKDINKDYIVSQYIAEYIKHLGFDGLCYMSSLHKRGDNITLFSESGCKFIGSYVYEVKDIIIKTQPAVANREAPDITPDF